MFDGANSRVSLGHLIFRDLGIKMRLKSIPNGQMHSWAYDRVNAHVHKKYLFCFESRLMQLQVSCNYAIFCWMFFRRYV